MDRMAGSPEGGHPGESEPSGLVDHGEDDVGTIKCMSNAQIPQTHFFGRIYRSCSSVGMVDAGSGARGEDSQILVYF